MDRSSLGRSRPDWPPGRQTPPGPAQPYDDVCGGKIARGSRIIQGHAHVLAARRMPGADFPAMQGSRYPIRCSSAWRAAIDQSVTAVTLGLAGRTRIPVIAVTSQSAAVLQGEPAMAVPQARSKDHDSQNPHRRPRRSNAHHDRHARRRRYGRHASPPHLVPHLRALPGLSRDFGLVVHATSSIPSAVCCAMLLPPARDPEKWKPVFGKDHAQPNRSERDGDSKKGHPALV
jgi:hypothetical protein